MRETEPRPSHEPNPMTLDEALTTINRFAVEHLQKVPHTRSLATMQDSIDIATANLSDSRLFDCISSTLLFSLDNILPDRYGTRETISPFEELVGQYAIKAISQQSKAIEAHIPHDSNVWALRLTELMVVKYHTDDAIQQNGMALLHKYLPVVQQGIRDNDYVCMCLIPTYLKFIGKDAYAMHQTINKIMRHGTNIHQIQRIFRNLLEKQPLGYLLTDFTTEKLLLLLERFGYTKKEAVSLQEAWRDSYPQHYPYVENIGDLYELELQEPGCTRYLMQKFGIRDFARYPQSVLLSQYRNRNDTTHPYGLVIYPRADHSGAYYQDKDIFVSLEKQLAAIATNGPRYNIRIVECGSLFDIGKAIVKTYRTYGPIHFAIIGAHGLPTQMQFGRMESLTRRHIEKGKGIQRMGQFFVPNPSIVLASCSTGRKSGLAEEMSRIGDGAVVIGPKIPTHIQDISVTHQHNHLSVSASYQDANAALYESGIRTRIVS